MTLDEWQARLQRHFEALRRERTALPGEARAVFALEHGLETADRLDLCRAVRSHIAVDEPRPFHVLPWVVYAAEVGYEYSGDEYWKTFEQITPGWNKYGDRELIRNFFVTFASQFGGVRPSGRWAQHFSIICWPITNSVLPQDLQVDLAQILFQNRDQLSQELLQSPKKLGKFIGSRAYEFSSRFQIIAEDATLIGQIAAALLLQEGAKGPLSIHATTLARIGADLGKKEQAKEWLNTASLRVHDQLHIKHVPREGLDAGAPYYVPKLFTRLLLKPSSKEEDSWDLFLEVPSLAPLLEIAEFKNSLLEQRCRVAGSSGGPVTRAGLLRSGREVRLSRLPRAEEPLLSFEGSSEALNKFLQANFSVGFGSCWIFRVMANGLAYELIGRRIRTNQRYLLITDGNAFFGEEELVKQKTSCDGVSIYCLDTPSAFASHWEGLLSRFSLTQAKTFDIWPAGAGAAHWDGESRGVWNSPESPCLAIRAKYELRQLQLILGDEVLELNIGKQGEVIYLEIPSPPVGEHSLRIMAREPEEQTLRLVTDFDIVIQEQVLNGLASGATSSSPFYVQVDPVRPSLEELWEGRAELVILGPRGHPVAVKIKFSGGEGEHLSTLEQTLPDLLLPVQPTAWRDHFDRYVKSAAKKESKAAQKYESYSMAEVELNAGELGKFQLTCERAFSHVRWVNLREQTATLFLDNANRQAPTVHRFTFTDPTVGLPQKLKDEYDGSPEGGLFLAKSGEFSAGIIVDPKVFGGSFSTISFDAPKVPKMPRSIEGCKFYLDFFSAWSDAKFSANGLAVLRRKRVLEELMRGLFRLICGDSWNAAEVLVGKRRNLDELWIAIRDGGEPEAQRLARSIATSAKALIEDDCSDRARWLVEQFDGWPEYFIGSKTKPRRLIEFSLRLASSPQKAFDWAGSSFELMMLDLLEQPLLAKASRALKLSIDFHYESDKDSYGNSYGWDWL